MLVKANHTGETALEYLVVAAIVIAVMGAALVSVAQSISTKLGEINADIGS